LRGAAARLGVQPSTVSHQLKSLEAHLGISLFSRTTRSVALTEAGQALFRGANPAFDQLQAALQAARDAGRSQRGSLRITMPGFAYDMVVADKLPDFRDAYPDIELEISVDETFVDLFEGQFHAGIRLGDRVDPQMIAIRVSPPLPLAVLGSEDYLSRRGEPATPQDLPHHDCIRYRFGQSGQIAPWDFVGPAGTYSVAVKGPLILNTLPAMYSAVSSGLGLGYSFADYRPAGTESGVRSLLRKFTESISGAFLYFPREYRSVELLRLFVDHIRLRD
ncbi:MAG: LysR substrate-binding domain-containing protein, partial [Verrucomicrobiota bacterium]